MKNFRKEKLFELLKIIFFINLIIVAISILTPTSNAADATVVGNNNGYGMITVNYHSNYVKNTAANGGTAAEVVYSITTPIYLNSKGEYCISFGQYKFAEKQVSSDGVKAPNSDANAIDTGFRGYTLTANPSGMRNSSGFWVGKATGSNGPDNIPDEILANSYDGVKRVFNDWEDGIYQQGDELVLNSSNLTGYNNIEYSAAYDTNRVGGTESAGDTRNTYTLDVYAQWVKANIIYVASASNTTKVNSLKTTFGISNITTAKIKTSMTSAIGAVKNVGNSIYENYIVITDAYNADYSSMGYKINIKETEVGNGFTTTSKYFGVDTSGVAFLSGDSILMLNDWRIRDIDLYSLKPGNMGINNFYSRGYMLIIEHGVRCFVGTTASAAKKNEVTSINYDGSDSAKRGCFNVNVDGHTGYEISRATYAKVLSGHVFRYLIDRQNAAAYANKYVYYTLAGTARADLLLAGPAQGTIQYTNSIITVKDQAVLASLYGGNQGHSSGNYWALDCKSYLNIYGNATIQDGIYGGGGGREANVPFYSGEIYINVCGGNVASIYGTGAASAVIPKSDGTDSNIYMNITGGTIQTIYGAGNGMSYDATGQVSTFSVLNGSLTGNITINTSNTTIGNLYGGGEGYNTDTAAKGCAYRNGDATITIGKGTIINGNVFGGGKGFSSHPKATGLSKVTKDLSWNTSGAIYTYKLSSDLLNKVSSIETASVVDGKTTININDGAIISGNVYGGGEYAGTTSTENVVININNGTVVGDVFGGGYSGVVEGDTKLNIWKGKFKNIYGAGDQNYVGGSTTVIVGNQNDLGIVVDGLVYGGGRGVDSNSDGDASDYTTVKGSSSVTIEGINTQVQNYGSVKLGAVAGDVDVLFKNYWTGNTTAKYKTMNGIDRATTVTFDNSYVLLENKDENGNLAGIKAIGSLVIPEGSGLKISADGEITNDFVGGGELYLDSAVCLTVGGDISGVTKIILNPGISTEYNAQIIYGGIENPYMKVKGTSLATDTESPAIELISGEKRYTILSKKIEENSEETSYYYITKTIIITDYVAADSTSAKDRIYNGAIDKSDLIEIKSKESFSSDIILNYELLVDNTLANEDSETYKNLSREFVIKNENQEPITIPAKTEITMKFEDKYYTYVLESDMTNVPLTKFKDDNNLNYSGGFSNLREEVEGEYNQVTNSTSYIHDETYRFIVNFKNTKSFLSDGRYYSMINVNDNNVWIDENQIESANIIYVKNRTYDLNYQLNQSDYIRKDIINLTGNLNIGEFENQAETTNLYVNMSFLNNDDENVNIPDGSYVTINNTRYYLKNGSITCPLIEGILKDTINQTINLSINMEGVLPQNRLEDGEYKIALNLINEENINTSNVIEKQFKIPFIINDISKNEIGLKANLVDKTGFAENANQIIRKEENAERTIKLEYNSNLISPKIKVKALERTSPFTYEETQNSRKISTTLEGNEISEITSILEAQSINLSFGEELEVGTYRIVFELYDRYNRKITETFVNFIVI